MNIRYSHRWFANLFLAFAAFGVSLSLVSTARGQSTTDGAISGTVYDQTGAVVPGATVVVHNNGTNLEQTVTTDASGFYKAVKLTPTTYTITFTAKGFEEFIAKEVVVTVGSVTNVSPHMTVGATTQSVTITGAAPQVNTTSADLTSTLNQTAIANLPIQRARWSAFSQLTPGVVQDANGYGLLSFRGVSTLFNNVTVDGADDNQAFFSEQRGRTRISYSDSEEAVQEFQVNTSNYSAEYGRAAGGVVNTVTKSGTNNWHGDASWKNRENNWAARNPLTTITELTSTGAAATYPTKPQDYWDIEAGSIGGPIVKDKLFLFVAYDNFYRKFPGDSVVSNPAEYFALPISPATLAGAGGTCTAASNTTYGLLSANVNSSSAGVYGGNSNVYTATEAACAIAGIVVEGSATPASYATGVTDYTTGLNSFTSNNLGTTPRTGKQNIIFPKLDYQINEKNRASVELNRMRWISPYGVQTQVANNYSVGAAMGDDNVSDTWGVAKLDSFITPNISNEFRYQAGMDFEWESAPPLDPWEVNELYTTTAGSTTWPSWTTYTNPFGVATYVNLSAYGALNAGTEYYDLRYDYPRELRNQATDTVTWSHGNHTLKFGGDFSHVNDLISNIFNQNGEFTYSAGIGNLLEDIYSPAVAACSNAPCNSFYSGFTQGFGTLSFNIPTDDLAFFLQDDWKVLPRLSLSMGLRWEYEHLPAPFFPNPLVPATEQVPNYKKNFGPRFGFAWDATGDGKTAVRGGFGIYYGRIMNAQIFSVFTQSGLIENNEVTGQPSFSYSTSSSTYKTPVFSSPDTGLGIFPKILTALPSGNGTTTTATTPVPAIMYFNPHYHNPEIDEADFSIERNVGWNTVLSLAYMGSFGHMLPQITDDNMDAGINSGTAAAPNCAGSGGSLTYFVQAGGPLAGPTYNTPFYACRPNPNFAQMIDLFGVSSNYNAFVVEGKHRLSHSIQFDANFTWAHALDYDSSTITSTTITASSGFNMLYPNNMQADYGNSYLDVPRRLSIYIVGNSPWHVKGRARYLTDGWEIAPIFAAQDGLPYSATISKNAPGILSNGGGVNGSDGTFRIPLRDNYRVPPSQDLDVRIAKTIPIKERVKIELFAEAYNLFNHYNVQGGSSGETTEAYSIATSGSVTDSAGNKDTCAAATPCLETYQPFQSVIAANNTYEFWTRQLQFGAKISF